MTTTPDEIDSADAIELLLPWYATGRLGAADKARVEAALSADPRLRLHLERIEAEREAAVGSAEALDTPSLRLGDRLFAEIGPAPVPRGNPFGRLGAWLAGLAAPQLGYGAAAAAIALLLVGGGLGHWLPGPQPAGYSTASGPEATGGAFVLIAFQPSATAADIEATIVRISGAIVDGPRAGGLYRMRIGAADLPAAARQAVLEKLTADTKVVKLVIAAP